MTYLYTGRCPEQCEDWASLIELADRLYLPELLDEVEYNCIRHLTKLMASTAPSDIYNLIEIVLPLVDSAKVILLPLLCVHDVAQYIS